MAGKPWSSERKAQMAARKAEQAAAEAAKETRNEAPAEVENAKEYSEGQYSATPAPRGNDRDELIEQIAARNNKENGIEEPKEEAKPEVKAETKEEQKEDAPKVEPEAPVEAAQPETPKPVKIKVDGEEYEVTQSEVDEAGGVRALQQIRASENRLKKTNEALAEAKRLQAFLIEQATKQAAPTQKEPSEDEFIQSKLDAIRYGTPEEGASAMREILSRQRVDPNQIRNEATNAAVIQIARNQAVQQFSAEFSDVKANPLLAKLASAMENERLEQFRREQVNPLTVDWGDFYRRIGNEIRSVVRPSQPMTAETKGNPSPASAKEERKASIVNLPTAAARAEMPKEEKPQTREDILEEMRSGRPL